MANVGSDIHTFCFFVNDPGAHDSQCLASSYNAVYLRGNHRSNSETPVSSCCSVKLVLVAKALMLPFCVGILCPADPAFLSCFLLCDPEGPFNAIMNEEWLFSFMTGPIFIYASFHNR